MLPIGPEPTGAMKDRRQPGSTPKSSARRSAGPLVWDSGDNSFGLPGQQVATLPGIRVSEWTIFMPYIGKIKSLAARQIRPVNCFNGA